MSDCSSLRQVARVAAHTDEVSKIRFSPCGRRFVSASWDGTAKIFDCGRGDGAPTLVHALAGHRDPVYDAAWSPCGTKIATAGSNGFVIIHDAMMGIALQRWRAHDRGVFRICFSPDSTRLITGSVRGGLVRVWDVKTRRQICEADTEGDYVSAAAFLPGGDEVLCRGGSDGDGQLFVHSASDGRLLHRIACCNLPVNIVAVSPDGSQAVVVFCRGHANIVSLADGSVAHEMANRRVAAVAWSPDSSEVAEVGQQLQLTVMDAASGRAVQAIATDDVGWQSAVAFSPDGRRIATGTAAGRIIVFERC